MERGKFIVVELAGYVDTIVNSMCLKSFIFTYKMWRCIRRQNLLSTKRKEYDLYYP